MSNKNDTYTKRRVKRMKNVEIIYCYELFDEKINVNKIFSEENIDDDQLKMISVIQKNYDAFIKTAKLFLDDDWTWVRMSPLTRAIILCASAELWNIDKKVIINEYIEITKDYIPDDTYKFINKILDKIGSTYEQIRNKKNK
ncbi:MAG: transcription antitermination protein NusB [Metamycoplasmataceae bacterium]